MKYHNVLSRRFFFFFWVNRVDYRSDYENSPLWWRTSASFFCFPVGGSIAAWWPCFNHISANLRAGKEATSGAFTEMKSRLCSVDTFILFLPSVRMWFMALKPLSHSAVHTRSVETAVRTLRMLSPVTPWHLNSWNSFRSMGLVAASTARVLCMARSFSSP